METLPREIIQEILSLIPLEDQPDSRLTCRLFAEMVPPTPKYQRYLGLVTDDPKLVASAVARSSIIRNGVCPLAAKYGCLGVLEWARANDLPWCTWTCSNAAKYGHLKILKWARANGCRWNTWTCSNAAMHNHLEVLRWARDSGCPWNKWASFYASQNGHLEVLKWIEAQGGPRDFWACVGVALWHGRFRILAWLFLGISF